MIRVKALPVILSALVVYNLHAFDHPMPWDSYHRFAASIYSPSSGMNPQELSDSLDTQLAVVQHEHTQFLKNLIAIELKIHQAQYSDASARIDSVIKAGDSPLRWQLQYLQVMQAWCDYHQGYLKLSVLALKRLVKSIDREEHPLCQVGYGLACELLGSNLKYLDADMAQQWFDREYEIGLVQGISFDVRALRNQIQLDIHKQNHQAAQKGMDILHDIHRQRSDEFSDRTYRNVLIRKHIAEGRFDLAEKEIQDRPQRWASLDRVLRIQVLINAGDLLKAEAMALELWNTHSEDFHLQREALHLLVEIYHRLGHDQNVIKYHRRLNILIEDSRFHEQSREILLANQRDLVQRFNQQLIKQRVIIKCLAVLLTLLLCVPLYFLLRRQFSNLPASEVTKIKQESNLPNGPVEVIGNASLLDDIKEKLKHLLLEGDNDLDSRTVRKALTSILSQIEKQRDFKSEWQEIADLLGETDVSFIDQLRVDFPQLTANEIKHIVLQRLGLTASEVARILHIETRSVYMARYRLRQKLPDGTIPHEVSTEDRH